MRDLRPAALALICAAFTLLIGSVALVHRATVKHPIVVASPSPPGVFEDGRLPLRPGATACVSPVNFTPATGQVRLRVQAKADPAPPLRISVRAGKKTTTGVVAHYRSGRLDDVVAAVAIDRPVTGSVCVRNLGTSPVGMASSTEPQYYSLSATTLDGHATKARMSLQFLAAKQNSILGRLGDAVRQDAQLTGVLSRPLVWLLLIAVLIAIAAGPLVAMTDVLRKEDD
jgi:hypothetical protein